MNDLLSMYQQRESNDLMSQYSKESSSFAQSTPLFSAVNIRAQNTHSLSIINKMRGIQANRLDNDLGDISLAEMYADSKLDTRVGGGQYNVTISDIYKDQDLYQAHHGLFTDGKVNEKESHMVDYELKPFESKNDKFVMGEEQGLYKPISFKENSFSFNGDQFSFNKKQVEPNNESLVDKYKDNTPKSASTESVSYTKYLEKKESPQKNKPLEVSSFNSNPFSFNKKENQQNKPIAQVDTKAFTKKVVVAEPINYEIYLLAKEKGLTKKEYEKNKKTLDDFSLSELLELKTQLQELENLDNMELKKESINIELKKVTKMIIKKTF